MTRPPSLFVSHGAPTLAIEDSAASRFLAGYGATLGRPAAILVVSAHWEAELVLLTGAEAPPTIHDFGGFPRRLYEMTYPAPGAPALAERAAALLRADGLEAGIDPRRGLDHGAWVPLSLLYPAADIPVVQLSIRPAGGPAHHRRLGRLLRPLRDEGVLLLASGSLTHNLAELHAQGAEPAAWAVEFGDWIAAAVEQGRNDDLDRYRSLAPHAVRNHPTDEHLLPLFTAAGAATPGGRATRIHHSHAYGALLMDAFAFE